MNGISYEIMSRVCDILTTSLITDIPAIVTITEVTTVDEDGNDIVSEVSTSTPDPTLAGAVVIGPLQGNPDPDEARISVEIYQNDPDPQIGVTSGTRGAWADEVEEIECGGAITWKRRFSIKARCLYVNTQEDLNTASQITSTVKQRIEETLLKEKFAGVISGTEYVSHSIFLDSFMSESLQAGGPNNYDFHLKFRFELWTTNNLGV